MVQVDMLIKEKEVFIMQLMEQFIWYYAYVHSVIFQAKSNRSIFRILGYHLHGVGDQLSKEKEVFIMQLMEQFIWYDAYVYSLIFPAKSNRSIFEIPGYLLHGVGGHVEQGDAGVHHLGGGLVQLLLCICLQVIWQPNPIKVFKVFI